MRQLKSSKKKENSTIDLEDFIKESQVQQKQYSRQECVELVGLPEYSNGEDLEDLMVNVFKVADVKVKKRGFRAIHRLANKKNCHRKICEQKGCCQLTQKQKN